MSDFTDPTVPFDFGPVDMASFLNLVDDETNVSFVANLDEMNAGLDNFEGKIIYTHINQHERFVKATWFGSVVRRALPYLTMPNNGRRHCQPSSTLPRRLGGRPGHALHVSTLHVARSGCLEGNTMPDHAQ